MSKKTKIVLGTIGIILLIIIAIFIPKIIRANYMINTTGSKIEELKQSNNYKITTTSYHRNYQRGTESLAYDEYYYKDGKYKITNRMMGINFDLNLHSDIPDFELISEDYGNVDSYRGIFINSENKTILDLTNSYKLQPKNKELSKIFFTFYGYKHDLGFFNTILARIKLATTDIRSEFLAGKDCFVITFKGTDGKEHFSEFWLDKENLIILKEIHNTNMSFEMVLRNLEVGTVTDENVDFKIENYEGYTYSTEDSSWNDEINEQKNHSFDDF